MRATTVLLISSLLSIAPMTPAVGYDSDGLSEMCLPIWDRTLEATRAKVKAGDQCRATGDRYSDECQEALALLRLFSIESLMPDTVKKVCLPVIVKHTPKETLDRNIAFLISASSSMVEMGKWFSVVAK